MSEALNTSPIVATENRGRLIAGLAAVLGVVAVISAAGSLQTVVEQSEQSELYGTGDGSLYFAAAVSFALAFAFGLAAVALVASIGPRSKRAAAVGLFLMTVAFVVLGIAEYGLWSATPACQGGCA